MAQYTGCPCGCLTKLPWFDDPDCIRNRHPVPPPEPVLVRDIITAMTAGRDSDDD